MLWNELTGSGEGSWISEELDISTVLCALTTSISWSETKPTGSVVTVLTSLSLDGGSVYSDWATASNGGSISGITNKTTDLGNAKLKVKVYMDNYSDEDAIPSIKDLTVQINATTYPLKGTWTSPSIDLSTLVVSTASTTFDISVQPTGTDVSVYTRTSGDATNWNAWQKVDTSGDTIYVDDLYLQAKVELESNSDRDATPVFDKLGIYVNDCNPRGVWTSPTVDLQSASELDYVDIVSNNSVESGKSLTLQSRSRASGASFGKWYNVLPSGHTQHEPNRYIQTRVVWTGLTTTVDSITISYDLVSSLSTVVGGLSKDYRWSFVTFQDTVYACNGVDGLFKYDGSTWSEVSTGLTEVFAILEVHQNRLFAVGYNDSLVYYSDILDGDTWNALNVFNFNNKDGDYVTALKSFGQYLAVSKNRTKALLMGDTTDNYSIDWMETPTGATGKDALVSTDKGLVFLSNDGIKRTNLVQDDEISKNLVDSFDKLTVSRFRDVAMAYWKDLILVAVPYETGYNSQVWVYNMSTDAWTILPDWNIAQFIRFDIRGEEALYGADSNLGQVYELFNGSVDIDVPVEYDFMSKDFTFGYPERFKLFKNFYLEVDKIEASSSVDVTFYVDDEEVNTVNIPVPKGASDETYVARLIPPSKNIILGYRVAWRFVGRNPIKTARLEYEVRSALPPTSNIV